MLTLYNEHLQETYTIAAIPLSDAKKFREQGVEFYDFTKLTAINTCPTWGILRYSLHKTDIPLTVSGRNLALECGKACHDFFAALRMWTLLQTHDDKDKLHAHAIKLFSRPRWESMLAVPQDADPQTNALNFSLDALHTSGYYDDPSDRKRTLSNMEAACINYLQRYFSSDLPVIVKGDFIGVEVPFVLQVTRTDKNGKQTTHYYCGRIDGVHLYGNVPTVGENKTSSNLNASWSTAFAISHQVTGYTIAGTCLLGEEINDALVMGTQIPIPRDVYNGVKFDTQHRTLSDRIRWCEWFFEGVATYERYVQTPTLAPRYSHSCNRYFSSCQFIPFCASERDEQDSILEAMRIEEWSPLDHLDVESGE